ncbi:hypothetical protein [Winogradskyella wandonensis]|nr:hypothetical protein [Winogradskyella wandonensis]
MNRKGSFTVLPKYQWEFKLQYSHTKQNYIIRFSIVILGFFILIKMFNQWRIYEHNLSYELIEIRKSQDDSAFNFLINSGKRRFDNGNSLGAYSEFKLAYAIYPDNQEVKELLKGTAIITCYNYGKHCEEVNVD